MTSSLGAECEELGMRSWGAPGGHGLALNLFQVSGEAVEGYLCVLGS